MADPFDVLTSALADRYTIERELGRGGAAAVFLAEDLRHHRRVALKILRPEVAAAVGPERFLHEIEVAAGLVHPHIVPLFDSGHASGVLYFVMPYVEGESLRARLDREGALPVDEALRIASGLADALDYAHAHGVIHRDVKPENVLLESGHAVLADFGVARAVSEAGDPRLTETGVAVGTPAYMSPEQALAEGGVDGRADVYSLGCLVYEMVSGEAPYRARTSLGLLARHLQAPVARLPVGDAVTPALSDAVARAMAKTPDGRFPSAGEFVAAALGGVPPAGRRPRAPWRRFAAWRPRLRDGIVAVLLVAATGVALLWGPGGGWAAAPGTVAVVARAGPDPRERDRGVGLEVAAHLTWILEGSDSLRPAPVTTRIPETTREALELARDLGVAGLVLLDVRSGNADTLLVEAWRYSTATGRPAGAPLAVEGTREEVVWALGLHLLRFETPGLGPRPWTHSEDPEALRAYEVGYAALWRRRLSEAAGAFRRALERDSTFAMGHHRLAQTLYWTAGADLGAQERVAPTIDQHIRLATVHARGLPPADSLRIAAFHSLHTGDFDLARELYDELLVERTNDAFALLMRGAIEFGDIWLDDSGHPRGDLEAAKGHFLTATARHAGFDLGYGHLFDLVGRVLETAYGGSCDVLEHPRQDRVRSWQMPDLQRTDFFCAVVDDGLRWVPWDRFKELDRGAVRAGADRFYREAHEILGHWLQTEGERPEPLEVFIDLVLTRRQVLLAVAPIDTLLALARELQALVEARLAVAADTAPDDLVLLANLHLQRGEPGLARAWMDEATRPEFDPLPASAANIDLATGRIAAALDRVRVGEWAVLRGGRVVPYAGAEGSVARLGVLAGLTEFSGDLLPALAAVDSLWVRAGYDGGDRDALWADATLELLPTLAADSMARRVWATRVEVHDPLWVALTASELDVARAEELVQAGRNHLKLTRAEEAFVVGHIWLRAGQPAKAAAIFGGIDHGVRASLGLAERDTDWALLTVAAFWRGRAWARAGDVPAARHSFETVVETWLDADEWARPLVDEARDFLTASGEGSAATTPVREP